MKVLVSKDLRFQYNRFLSLILTAYFRTTIPERQHVDAPMANSLSVDKKVPMIDS